MTESLTIDAALGAKLTAAGETAVELRDDTGKLVAVALTPDALRRMELELAKRDVTRADLDRIAAAPGGRSMDDVLQLLESP